MELQVEQSQKKIRCEVRHRRELQLAEEVLQDDESDFVPRSSYAALQLQLQAVQKELDALQARSRDNIPAVSEQQVSDEQRNAVPRGTCPCAEERYKELTEEVRQLRAINMELQKTLSYKLFQSVPAKPVEKATMPRELVQREPASVGNPGDADLRSATVEGRGATESLQSTPQSNTAGASSFRLEDLESRDTSATSQVEDIGVCRLWVLD
ncbi:hypothetical protein HPB49_009991 [Dermacentor silvarum]|uniref:Uncharacterized protein n=1 Tax=Dermacentor silvarum TaxID=543639 RepID=A0ACB8DYJ7_DERSI|nr:hypothetical protein HPB49_009991 [Dermacentor silvarum]